MITTPKERFAYIDSLRGIAIAGVIITHCASIVGVSGFLRRITDMGGFGVQLFFVISAFTIFYSLSKSDGKASQVRNFFVKRLFRIVPIYWLGIILYTLVYGLASRGWREGAELWHYPFHIFLVNVLNPETSSSVVPGGWSISCEVLFYMLVPVLYKYAYSNRNLLILLFFSFIIYPFINRALTRYGMANWVDMYSNADIRTFFFRWLPNQLACFVFGIILFKIYIDNTYVKYISNKMVNMLLTICVCLSILAHLRFSLPFLSIHHIYAFSFMCLALLLSVRQWSLFVNPFTVFLGQISYSCYLLHFLVVKQCYDLILYLFPSIGNNIYNQFLILTVVSFLITMPLAFLSYKYIELGAVKLGRSLITRLDNKNEILIRNTK